jgi:hypothetical protein
MELKRTGGWYVAREKTPTRVFTGLGPTKTTAIEDLKASIFNYEINKGTDTCNSKSKAGRSECRTDSDNAKCKDSNSTLLDTTLAVRRYNCPAGTKRKA